MRGQDSSRLRRLRSLAAFAADYYQRPLGEVALPGLPKNLRVLTTVALDRAIRKLAKLETAHDGRPAGMPQLNPAWLHALTFNANSSRGLYIVAEPEGTFRPPEPAKEMVFMEVPRYAPPGS